MLQLLNYCVYCRKIDPVFILLAKNYQLLPDSMKALSLYDEFIAAKASLTLSIHPGADFSLAQTIDKMRNLEQLKNARISSNPDQSPSQDDADDDIANAPFLPPKFLFDGALSKVKADTNQVQSIESQFDPAISAVDNLPGKTLSGVQIQYVEHVWKPARNRLVTAGFRMVANVGG